MATSKAHNASISSLHDIVLDYVNHHALAQTARVLSRPKGTYRPGPGSQNGYASTSRDGVMTDIAEEREDGDGRNGANSTEGADGMDVDISTQSAASGSGSHEKTFSQSELASIEHRRAILNFILNGAIMRAVEALNIHFPYVLDDTNPASDHQSARSSYDTHASIVNWNNASMPSSSNHASPVGLQSTLPAHVKLNLQIQQFIESFRQLGRSSPSSPSSSISSMTSSMHMSISGHLPSNGNGNGNGVGNGKAPHDGSRAHSSTAALTAALTAAQGLHAEAKKLPSDIRAVYLQEIKDVGALFAYTDPETSILKGFLDQSRRVALAGQVNRAILSRGSVAILQEMAQRTTAIYNVLGEKGVDVRPTTAELSRDQLSQYWKHQGSSQFRLHDFVEQSWN